MDTLQASTIRMARSMEVFADGDATFVWGDWKAWVAACEDGGITIPPAEFKALPKEKRDAYLKNR